MGATLEAWRLRVSGIVQGVGFRPFVYGLAMDAGVKGFVLNDPEGVLVEAHADRETLESFAQAIRERAPALARVDSVAVEVVTGSVPLPEGFDIRESGRTGRKVAIVPADSHVCEPCLAELRNPSDRRHRYPFINCTNCGPRYSLIQSMPYDRPFTTMGRFVMCAACQAEYDSPADRRYHAQPNACPECGPRLFSEAPGGKRLEGDAALAAALDVLREGGTVAVKSVGGFHLAVDATNADAIARLRRRKRRDGKPFAVMVASVDDIDELAHVGRHERELLASPARPIVLVRKKPSSLPEAIAPQNPSLGFMLASAPLHYLLLWEGPSKVLVMTSGNVSGYPIAFRNEDALPQLFEVADRVLYNDRDIETRVDDSVVRCSADEGLEENVVSFLRRSRGYAPCPVDVAEDLAPIVALGAELKTTVAVADAKRVYLSQHIGDLKNDETLEAHARCARHLAELHDIKPAWLACDLHPAFRSARAASRQGELSVVRVQHHHAHMASCMAENRLVGPTLGVIFDGAGYGLDEAIWGGEFLLGDYLSVERKAHLRYVPLLGGDQAVHFPMRMGLAYALDTWGPSVDLSEHFPLLRGFSDDERRVLEVMFKKRLNSPWTSSMGRLFDAAAALLGVCTRPEYEAQGPIELEGLLGRDFALREPYPHHVQAADESLEIDVRPIIDGLSTDRRRGVALETVSRRFHSSIVHLVEQTCVKLREATGVEQVVLSGGVFLNEYLLVNCLKRLRAQGFVAKSHRLVPTNDGGISLGQLMVANARIRAAQGESGELCG